MNMIGILIGDWMAIGYLIGDWNFGWWGYLGIFDWLFGDRVSVDKAPTPLTITDRDAFADVIENCRSAQVA